MKKLSFKKLSFFLYRKWKQGTKNCHIIKKIETLYYKDQKTIMKIIKKKEKNIKKNRYNNMSNEERLKVLVYRREWYNKLDEKEKKKGKKKCGKSLLIIIIVLNIYLFLFVLF